MRKTNNFIKKQIVNLLSNRFWNKNNGKRYVLAYDKYIDGKIAEVKKLISASSLFLTESSSSYNERTVIIDNFDLTGLSVMDLIQNPENKNEH